MSKTWNKYSGSWNYQKLNYSPPESFLPYSSSYIMLYKFEYYIISMYKSINVYLKFSYITCFIYTGYVELMYDEESVRLVGPILVFCTCMIQIRLLYIIYIRCSCFILDYDGIRLIRNWLFRIISGDGNTILFYYL